MPRGGVRAMNNWLQRGVGLPAAKTLSKKAAILLSVAMVWTATPQFATAQDYQFSQLVIEGNERIEPQTIITFAGIGKGQAIPAGFDAGTPSQVKFLQGAGQSCALCF